MQRFSVFAAALLCAANAYASEPARFLAVGGAIRPPIGWLQFCQDRPHECRAERTKPLDVELDPLARREMEWINRFVNARIQAATDEEQYGVVEKWTYPDSGYGDCEDYVLLKRRMLMQLGWPQAALLITVVKDRKGEGHAVLTVRTTRGEVILDNLVEDILPWAETGYTFHKRQSQEDPNIWVGLAEPPLQVTVGRY